MALWQTDDDKNTNYTISPVAQRIIVLGRQRLQALKDLTTLTSTLTVPALANDELTTNGFRGLCLSKISKFQHS